MRNDLGLNVPGRGDRSDRPGRFQMALIAAVIAVLLALVMMFGFGEKRASRAETGGLSAKKLEALALKFENQKLPEAAARAWTEYLGAASLGDEEAAQVWFRVGKLYQEGTDYERAIEAYYRSEALAKVPDLETELGQRTTACLEAMGKFAAADQNLVERTAVVAAKPDTSKAGKEVLAEIGTQKITRADLNQIIESEVDAQLSQMSGGFSAEEKAAEKKRILDGIAKQGGRDKLLEQFVAEELLYRFAVEQKLGDDPEVRALTRNLERKILSQKLMDREFARRIVIDPAGVRQYYDAHKDEFKKDGAQLTFEQAKDQAAAALRFQRAMEVQQQVLGQLRDKYNVVIHTAKLGGK